MALPNIIVIGAGQMGSGIAQVAAVAGHPVTLIDPSDAQRAKARGGIADSLTRQAKKGTITTVVSNLALGMIELVDTIENCGGKVPGCPLVIEAVFEDEKLKKDVWTKLDAVMPPETIFASNTSSISITKMASFTKRPDKFIGLHFFNPVPVLKLVEVIRGARTSDATVKPCLEWVTAWGKTPIEVNDFPGFVSNRVLMPLINEAIFAVYEGVAKPDAVDNIFKLGMAHPMGPLALADLIGLDTCLNIMNVLLDGFADPKYRPCPLLKQMVAAGKLGRKSGEGFFKYEAK